MRTSYDGIAKRLAVSTGDPMGGRTAALFRMGAKAARVLWVRDWRRALVRQHVAAGLEHVSVLRNLGDVRTVVDIGANRGQFALAAHRVWPEATVISFEPLSVPAGVYRSVFALNGRVRLITAAIGPERGHASIHEARRDDSSSLLPITGRQKALFPGTEEVGTCRVRVARLVDEMSGDFERPAILKLDVQGFELQALQGCEDLLHRFDWVYVECSFIELYAQQALADQVLDWLGARDFVLRGVYNPSYDGRGAAVQGDFLLGRRGQSTR